MNFWTWGGARGVGLFGRDRGDLLLGHAVGDAEENGHDAGDQKQDQRGLEMREVQERGGVLSVLFLKDVLFAHSASPPSFFRLISAMIASASFLTFFPEPKRRGRMYLSRSQTVEFMIRME